MKIIIGFRQRKRNFRKTSKNSIFKNRWMVTINGCIGWCNGRLNKLKEKGWKCLAVLTAQVFIQCVYFIFPCFHRHHLVYIRVHLSHISQFDLPTKHFHFSLSKYQNKKRNSPIRCLKEYLCAPIRHITPKKCMWYKRATWKSSWANKAKTYSIVWYLTMALLSSFSPFVFICLLFHIQIKNIETQWFPLGSIL